ncbi:XDD4 family exosortase-dependent surface protein [Aerosakkonemataceae cyanobacterium BLCC-F50]|uniref:XDD4 family exosortase-dependent surface protein n=1 Tax=Floridaenema flaviceps BLCC-F50 TaxID=3153642 RepID=A0ABV4XX78_9CYAN
MLKHFPKLVLGLSALSLVAIGQISKADAASVTFTGTGTNTYESRGQYNGLAASAIFDDALNPGKLTITLSNIGPGASVPSDILTALFWDYNGSPLSNLSLFSATAPLLTNGRTNVNLAGSLDEWKLPNGSITAISQDYGIGTAGLGIFQGGGGQQMDYGIVSNQSYDRANPAVSGGTFVKGSATFVLAGLPTGFDIGKIGNVRFQYGTALNEPSITQGITVNYSGYTPPSQPPSTGGGSSDSTRRVPEPGTTLALGVVAISALKLRKRNSVAQA